MFSDLLARIPVHWFQLNAGFSCVKFMLGNCVGCLDDLDGTGKQTGKTKQIEEILEACTTLAQHKHLHRGQTDEYRKVRTLGTGTFSRVFLVEHGAGLSQSRQAVAGGPRRYYAMKVLHKAHLVLLKQAEHANQERAVLASLRSPFVVDIYQHWQDACSLYMLMEYVPGGELFAHLRRAGRFQPHAARFYAAELVLALEYLHDHGIIYRDLKPENVLLDSRGHVKLTDFGFAKRMDATGRTYTVVGTPDYIAPEIIRGCGYTHTVDWWALGVLVYEMLVGEAPFSDENHLQTYQKILDGRWNFPHEFDPQARDFVRRLGASDPDRRLGSKCAGRNGAADVKAHCWFSGVSWTDFADKAEQAPFVPKLDHEGDASNFEEYDEQDSAPPAAAQGDVDPYSSLFLEFNS
eukprot:TRINITY_DN640_c0_g1_i1.p1 TRINITY_DN640_c0_g1~~TRINITY_DN640_c0_g1_i1.p1  ORF type:complete len:406 (-),score=85.25 TRINITY_DN640_c0_g1_i1:245-1462(-)